MKNDICLECNVNCIDVDTIWIQCPQCGTEYVRSTVSVHEYSIAYPSASTIPRAYNPVWGASTFGQIKELMGEGYPNILGRRW